MRYNKTLWDTNTIYNPTNMNHIEQGIYDADLREGGTINGQLNIINANLNVNRGLNGDTTIFAGGTISSGASSSRGIIRLFHTNDKYVQIYPSNTTENRNITLPDKSGTIALASDIIPVAQMGNVTSTSLNSDYDKNYIKMGYLQDSGLPLYGAWGTVLCQTGTSGATRVANQTIVCPNGIAFRHYEGSSWSAWKKTSFA